MQSISGTSGDRHHPGWLDVLTAEWAVSRAITSETFTRGDRESANAVITDLEILRRMDCASPALFIAACCGRGETMLLELTKTGAGQGSETYLRYTLHHALVSSYDVEANSQDVTRPLERLTISFTDIEVQYTPDDQDGNPLPPIAVGFNTATNERR